jgi:hypothetical protein
MLRPPFCPHRGCDYHVHPDSPEARRLRVQPWFIHCGFYTTFVRGRIARFRCTGCGAGFSEQTFRLDYYVKRRVSYRRIGSELKSCSAIRHIARSLSVSPATVINRISRLSRQALAAQAQLLLQVKLAEHLCADGFESFAVSQFYPNNIHLLVGRRSQFAYCADYVSIRRKGTMTDLQRLRRTALEMVFRAHPQGIRRSFRRITHQIDRLAADCTLARLILFTDRNRAYADELRANGRLARRSAEGRFLHCTVSSRAARTLTNPLFAVNYLDRQLRKDLHEHTRETVCFARNPNNSMERLWVYLWQHNCGKRYRELQPVGDERTHRQVAGIDAQTAARINRQFFSRRRFISLEPVRGLLRLVWMRKYPTPLRGVNWEKLKWLIAGVRKGASAQVLNTLADHISRTIGRIPEYLPRYALK